MFRTLIATGLAAVIATSALASGDLSAERMDEIRATLTEQGYEVRKLDMEDGMIEAYVVDKDGKRMELYLDAALNVVKTKAAD